MATRLVIRRVGSRPLAWRPLASRGLATNSNAPPAVDRAVGYWLLGVSGMVACMVRSSNVTTRVGCDVLVTPRGNTCERSIE
jgi:hypothetical protein